MGATIYKSFFWFCWCVGIWHLTSNSYLFICMILLVCGKTTWKYYQVFLFHWCMRVWFLEGFVVFLVVLLMHGDLTCWHSFKYFVVMLMCGGKKLEVIHVFSDSIDAWGQQLTSFMTFVVLLICGGFQCWPVSCDYVNF
jgi:hypothetical protein